MIVRVRMWAFQNGTVRVVNVPDDEWEQAQFVQDKLDLVFHFGQNDFQPVAAASVSVADVIELEGHRYVVKIIGFRRLTAVEYLRLIEMPQRDRHFCELVNEPDRKFQVYVVAWQYDGGAGFDWYWQASRAAQAFREELENVEKHRDEGWSAYRFNFDTDTNPHADATEITEEIRKDRQEITDEIDALLDDLCAQALIFKENPLEPCEGKTLIEESFPRLPDDPAIRDLEPCEGKTPDDPAAHTRFAEYHRQGGKIEPK